MMRLTSLLLLCVASCHALVISPLRLGVGCRLARTPVMESEPIVSGTCKWFNTEKGCARDAEPSTSPLFFLP